VKRSIVLIFALLITAIAIPDIAQAQERWLDPNEQLSEDGSLPPQIITVPRGTTFTDLLPHPGLSRQTDDLDPGVAPEGDYTGEAVFTRDGQRVLVTNRLTDNVTVLDALTMTPLTNFAVGNFPQGIACSDDYAVIACAFSDEAWVIDLDDYSTAAIIPTAEQPWVVRIDAAGERAYIACDIPDICEVIDLGTLTHSLSIPNFSISLVTFSFGSETGRSSVTFTNFELTLDGQYLVTGDRDAAVLFFDTQTGAVAHTVSGVINCPTVGLSGDGAVVVALGSGDPARAYQIDVASFSATGSVAVSGHSLRTYQVGVDPTGDKAFLGVSNNSSAIVNFPSSSYSILTSTYTPFSIGTSPDHTLALGIQYRYSVIDFASETLLGQVQGIPYANSAVSPVGTRTVAFHEVFDESLHFHDYANPSAPQYLGSVVAGLAPEGDAPRRLAIAPDNSKAVVTNVLSDNATIVDLQTQQVTSILAIGDRVQNVAITSDSRWAVICGFNSNSVFIIDLETDHIVAEVPTGTRAGTVVIAPDDSHAYVGNISSNTVSVVELAGAASSEVAEVYCGIIGVVWAAYGVSSGLACSPTGEYVLVAASFDDRVKVLDTASNTIVASLVVGDFPIQVAFGRDGDYAVVTNYFSNDYTIMHIDGAASSVVGTYAAGTRPLRTAYHHRPGADWLGLAHYESKNFVRIDPASGAVLDSWSYAAYGSLLQAEFAWGGQPIALTSVTGDQPAMLHYADGHHELPGQPAAFAVSPDRLIWGAVIPGPDYLSLVYMVPVDVIELVNIPLHGPGSLAVPSPNPTGGETRLSFALRQNAGASLVVYDLRGRKVAELARGQFLAGDHQVIWNGRDTGGRLVPAGVYCVELRVGQFRQTQRVVMAR